MARTGSALVIAVALAALNAHAQSVTMQADRVTAGIEDTFRLDIVVTNAPDGSVLHQPELKNFEVLGRSESTQMQFNLANGQQRITQVRKLSLTLRANRTGALQIPPASLSTDTDTLKSDPVNINVVKGRLQADRQPPPQQQGRPFGFPPGFPFGGMDEPDDAPVAEDLAGDDLVVPRSDSDLFLRMSLDKNEAYVGEQVMLTIHLYSRVDLSSVDAVTMPKLDGFLSKDFKSPTQLSSTQRVINGVPYREFLLRQRALFPLKPGSVTIEGAESDITTGNILYAGRRVHRAGNDLKLTVKNLPPGPATTLVGRWRMSREISHSDIALGEPLQVKLLLEGRGNLDSVTVPPINAPASFKTFDPVLNDKQVNSKAYVGGTRTVEYTLVPQQTGTFVLPAVTLPYFDPEARKFEELRVDEITITVRPGAGGANVVTVPGTKDTAIDTPKNQLVAGGLKSLRHTAHFVGATAPLSSAPWFLPIALAPVLFTLLGTAFAFARGKLGAETDAARQSKAAKAARKQLAGAEKLMKTGSPNEYYGEITHALLGFMSAKLGEPVVGFTRDQLVAKLSSAGVQDAERARITAVLDVCDEGRYAPGYSEASARKRVFDDAAKAMEGWP
jgi:hypothetical protein